MRQMKIRIKQARLSAGLTQQDLADVVKKSRGMVGMWESLQRNETPQIEDLITIAKRCGTTVGWLATGEIANVSNVSEMSGTVPLLSWAEAGDADKTMDMHMPDADRPRFLCPVEHGPKTYCLKVEGPSMASSNQLEKTYPDKSIIYCDPDQKDKAAIGSPVIVTLTSTGETLFKSYYRDGGKEWLRSLNPAFPDINDKFEVKALVIGVFIS